MNEEIDLKFDFSTFKLAVVISAILTFMKIAGWIDISIWIILLPVFIAIGVWFILIFLIGLVTILILVREMNKDRDELDTSSDS